MARNKTEGEYKIMIRDSVEYCGGVAFPLEGLYTKGVPDLFLTLPNSFPRMAEVKVERDLKLIFRRKIKYAPKQWENIQKLYSCNPMSILALVVCEIQGHVALVALPPYETHLSSKNMAAHVWMDEARHQRFDMIGLLKAYHKHYMVKKKELEVA